MPAVRTHYDNLQIARNASPEVIRAAYKGLTQRYHPDRNPNDRERCERIMKAINQAFEVLSDPQRRAAHDAWIAEQEAAFRAESAAAVGEHEQVSANADSPFPRLDQASIGTSLVNNTASYEAMAAAFRLSRMNPGGAGDGYAGPLYREYTPLYGTAHTDRIAAAREAYRAERNRVEAARETYRAEPINRTAAVQVGGNTAPPRESHPPPFHCASPSMQGGQGQLNFHRKNGLRWAWTVMRIALGAALAQLFYAFRSNQFKGLVGAVLFVLFGIILSGIAFVLGWLTGKQTTPTSAVPNAPSETNKSRWLRHLFFGWLLGMLSAFPWN